MLTEDANSASFRAVCGFLARARRRDRARREAQALASELIGSMVGYVLFDQQLGFPDKGGVLIRAYATELAAREFVASRIGDAGTRASASSVRRWWLGRVRKMEELTDGDPV